MAGFEDTAELHTHLRNTRIANFTGFAKNLRAFAARQEARAPGRMHQVLSAKRTLTGVAKARLDHITQAAIARTAES
jgi:hypothetical protein